MYIIYITLCKFVCGVHAIYIYKQCSIFTPRIFRSTPSDNAFGVHGLLV